MGIWVIVCVLVSLMIYWIAVVRVKGFTKQYHLFEDSRTRLMGFLDIRHVMILYAIFVVSSVVLGAFFVVRIGML